MIASWARKPVRAPDQPPLFLHELVDAAPAGARVPAGFSWMNDPRAKETVRGGGLGITEME